MRARSNPEAVVARDSGLRYVSDEKVGITRYGKAGKFCYRSPEGNILRNSETLRRIRSLVIPPAWNDVWISPQANGHIQATGRDARGRKQYRYHAKWREVRDEAKYERVLAFGGALPKIRRNVAADLRRKGLSREKVLAIVVRLLETTLIRVGNDEYAQNNGSYGLTTLQNRHARVTGSQITFEFKGKGGIRHRIGVRDPKVAKLVRRCQHLPGQELFGYIDSDGAIHDVTSDDVNTYLHEIAGDNFSAKDFRTWAGTILAAIALREFGTFSSTREAKRNVVQAIVAVAKMLGNTPAICRRCYVHPSILDGYLAGQTIATLHQSTTQQLTASLSKLQPEEAAVMTFLRERLTPAALGKGSRRASSLATM